MSTPRVKIFNVYLLPQHRRMAETAEFVEDGFSYGAFFFGPLWALCHRMWLVAFLELLYVALVQLAQHRGWIVPPLAGALSFVCYLFVGLEATNFRHRGLLKRGYVHSDVVAEDSALHAQQRYYTRHSLNLG